MAKVLNSAFDTLETSEADIYTAPSKSMTMLIQTVNTHSAAVTYELWITDGSNNKVACLVPSKSRDARDGTSDTGKHVIPSGYKIRGTATTTGVVYVEISVVEGV